MDEQKLIESISKGEPQAFRQLYDTYQNHVYNTAYAFLHLPEDAQDITQEVFVELYQSLNSFRGHSRLSTWIYRITVNKSLNHLRKKKTSTFFSKIRKSQENGQKFIFTEPADNQLTPSEILENRELQQELQTAIDALPEKQRIAFILDKFEELPYKEIAVVMGTSLSSVESLLFRARQNLQKTLLSSWKER